MAGRVLARLALFGTALASAAVASAVPPLSAYGSLPGFERAAISPSGDRYAIVGVVGAKRSIVVVGADKKPLFITSVGDKKVRRIGFADNDHVLVWLTSTESLGPDFVVNKHELTAAVVIDAARKTMMPLLNKAPVFGGVRNYFGSWRDGSHLYGAFSAITLGKSGLTGQAVWDGDDPDLYRADLDTGDIHMIAKHSNNGDRDWIVAADGKIAATLDTDTASGRWTVRDAAGKDIARGTGALGGTALLGIGRQPGSVAYAITDGSHHTEWFEASAAGPPAALFADVDAASVETDRATRAIVGYTVLGDQQETHYFDARREARSRGIRKAFPGLTAELVDASDSFDALIVKTEGSGDAGTWWAVDIKTGRAAEIGLSYPQVLPTDVGPVRMVAYKAADGLVLAGVLTLPPGRAAKALPLVVLPHGGPAARDYPGFDWWAQALASRGYAVFQPNFRGSTGYGEALRAAGDGEWGSKMQTDISDGVAELARQGIVDPRRACIVGASYGGYAALAGVTVQQGLYRCAVSVAGVSDIGLFLANESRASGQDKATLRYWRTTIGTARKLSTISPAALAAHADAPILLIHGTDDTVVPYAQSERMASALRSARKPVEIVGLAGEDHWLSLGTTRQAMLDATVTFLLKHNPPD